MAISKHYLYDDPFNNTYNYLLENAVPEYFTSVTKNDDELSISCYIDELEFLKIYPTKLHNSPTSTTEKGGILITTKSGAATGLYSSKTGYTTFNYAYKCNNGIAFSIYSEGIACVTITKDNEGNTVIICPTAVYLLSSSNTIRSIYVVSPEVREMKALSFCKNPCVTLRKSVLCPFVVPCENGNYTPNAFFVPFSDTIVQSTIEINGERYLYNGYWCIKD